ncbi:MAG: hypothetical protein MRY49_02170 [Candidatus Pacebacteria bacterium]|nr:hypothetical protein [Candidatus Paceibacterota bacterium]
MLKLLKMDYTEKIALDYLKNLGHTNIVYEPEGNCRPPDFHIKQNNVILAVEVRRFNQQRKNPHTQKYQGNEYCEISDFLRQKLSKLSAPYHIDIVIRNLFSHSKKKLKKSLEEHLKRIDKELSNSNVASAFYIIPPQKWVISSDREYSSPPLPAFSIEYIRCKKDEVPTIFSLNSDSEGGWASDYLESLQACIDEKDKKMEEINQTKWLILVVYKSCIPDQLFLNENFIIGVSNLSKRSFKEVTLISSTSEEILKF